MRKYAIYLGILATASLPACLQSTTAAQTADANTADVNGQTDAAGGDASTGPVVWQTNPVNAPTAMHLTWQHDPATTVTVQWTTAATDLKGYTPKAWFDTKANAGADGAKMAFSAAQTATGAGELYYQSLVAGDTTGPQYLTWTVELTGLTPDTDYVLRAGTWSDYKNGAFIQPDLTQEVMTFHTAPKKGTRQPVKVVLAGDSRGGNALITANADRLAAIGAAFWVFNGDFTDMGLQAQWDAWFLAMHPILNGAPLMPVQGNHEVFPPMYYGQFALPVNAGVPDNYTEHAWSMNYANIHVVGLDSTSAAAASDQAAWLDADLTAARADADIDWIIVAMHYPAYSACTNHGSTAWVQKYWVPLFEKHNVDLVFAGHDHNYERTWPWVNNNKAAKGPVYVVAGGFFADGYTNGSDIWTATSTHGNKHNYVVMTVNDKKLDFTAYSGDGATTLDQYSIQK